MAYGLRIINDSNELLVDSEFVNPTFVQKLEFNTTPTFVEDGLASSQVHPGYIRRDYSTANVTIGAGSYIVLWSLPDSMTPGQPTKDVWYQFPTSVSTLNLSFDCSVYANNQAEPLTYTLPTAYIFTIDAAGVNAMSSTGPALRMYNNSNVKTFDSNFLQLVPINVSNNYNIPTNTTTTSLFMALTMANPIFLLPKTAIMFAGDIGGGFSAYKVFDVVYKRTGQYLDTRTMSTSYNTEDYPIGSPLITFPAGTFENLTVISANGDFYAASGAANTGSTVPTYTLSRSASTVNEGSTFTITLTTTLVNNNTSFAYTVTGINAADLDAGSLTGTFVIQNNSATASFTLKNDTLTEGTETFLLSISDPARNISVNVLDTSKAAIAYAFSAPSSTSISELFGPVTVDFNAVWSSAYPITFALAAPTAGNAASQPSGWSFTENTTDILAITTTTYSTYTTVNIKGFPDFKVEGTEYFRVSATVDGGTYYSQDIAITDTSTSSITTTSSWAEQTSNNVVTINIIGATSLNAQYSNDPALKFYLTSSNTSAITLQSGYASNWTPNSDNYSVSTRYVANAVTTDTVVTLYLRLRTVDGPIVAQKDITVTDAVVSFNLTANSTWPENSTGNTLTIDATNYVGNYLYLTSSNTAVANIESPYPSIFYTDSNSYSVDAVYTTYPVTTNTNVTLSLRTGSSSGTVVKTKTVTVTNEASTYTLGYTWTSQDNGIENTFTLTVGNPNTGTTVTVAKSGAGASRVTLGTTSFTTSSSITMYNITVTSSSPTAAVAAQSVTITLSFSDGATSKAFTFTLAAYTPAPAAIWRAWDTTSATTTWTVPAGVTSIRVALCGGGGGGGNGGTIKGGGGAGQVRDVTYAVSAGQVLTITAGAGGAGGVAGGSSSISGGTGGTITALGGNASVSITGGSSGSGNSGGGGSTGASGGGGGSGGLGSPGVQGEEGGMGGVGTSITTNAAYYIAGGGGGAFRGSFGVEGYGEAGGGTGAFGGLTGAQNGGAATFYGSGGGGSINSGTGGAGFRGIVMWYG